MSSLVWKKRQMKLRGLANLAYSYSLLRYTRINRAELKKQIAGAKIDRLHVGCGNVLLEGWLNIFFEPREEYGRLRQENNAWLLNYNLLKVWPINDGTIQYVAGSHFIEHLDLNHGIAFLKECYCVMKKGGVIRLSCPDLELYARSYINRNHNFFNQSLIREGCTFKAAQTYGEIFIAKAYDSGGSHKWFYDFESLQHIMQLAGFVHVKRCQRLEGQMPDLEMLEPIGREIETVYVEATKKDL